MQRLPGGVGGEAGLVVDAVEGIVGQQVQLEALARGAGLDEASLRAGLASGGGRSADQGEAAVAFERDVAFEDGMAGRFVPQSAA